MSRTSAMALSSVLCVGLLCPASSEACMHVMTFDKDDAVAAVARADRQLSEGLAISAYRTARQARRQLERHARAEGADASSRALIERAGRITAVAVVRLDGRTPLDYRTARRHVVRGREQRSLGWALQRLRAFSDEHPDDLRARVHYAEALARFAEHRSEAAEILTRLADRDLIPDAHGYATLLRVTSPRSEAWDTALTRCQEMASDHASRICPSSSVPGS